MTYTKSICKNERLLKLIVNCAGRRGNGIGVEALENCIAVQAHVRKPANPCLRCKPWNVAGECFLEYDALLAELTANRNKLFQQNNDSFDWLAAGQRQTHECSWWGDRPWQHKIMSWP